MFMRPMFRFVPDDTRIKFMRARFFGLMGSFLLSTISVVLFFYPGLNLGIDFKGGVVMEVQTVHPADIAKLRAAFAADHIQLAGLQTFGGPNDLLVRLDPPADTAGADAEAAGAQPASAPIAGAPASGAPASGVSGSGAPVSGTQVSGAPVSGAPVSGAQVLGAPAAATPAAGARTQGAQVTGTQAMEARVRATLSRAQPDAKVLRSDVVGASVSSELFTNGMLALAISLAMIMAYIWFRFEWQFAVGAVVTLLLDVTKTIGFLVVTRIQFDLVMVAAILTIIGYSTNDKVVVYDRVRENLRKYKSMPLRDLIDLSINETLNRTLGTSCTVFLASLPLAIWGGETLSGFAWTMLFGIAIGTVSSIMIAAPILLLLGEHRLRRDVTAVPAKPAVPASARP